MAIRLLATYEFIDKVGRAAGMVRLPVIGYAPPDDEGWERPHVLLLSGDYPAVVDFHPDSTLETRYGTLEALLIAALADPIPARPGWVAELWIEGQQPRAARRLPRPCLGARTEHELRRLSAGTRGSPHPPPRRTPRQPLRPSQHA